MKRLLLAGTALLVAVTAAAFIVLPALGKGTGTRLDAKVVATNPGPLPPCSGSDCTNANAVREFIYVENGNALTNLGSSPSTRADRPNALVVSSIDQATFIDGVQDPDFDATYVPPPNPDFQNASGRWPVTGAARPKARPAMSSVVPP